MDIGEKISKMDHKERMIDFNIFSSKIHFETIENICPFEVVVLNELRDYYWIPNHARYVEEYTWEINQTEF